jgi:hypothetical protein
MWNRVLVLSVGLSTQLSAQQVNGTVRQEVRGTPVGGAVVVLLDAMRDTVLSRSATTEAGRYHLGAPSAGQYRVRVLRLGQRPVTRELMTLQAGQSTTLDIVVADQPVQLTGFNVRAESECRSRPDSSALAWQLLTEARTAFLASVSSSPDGESRATYRRFRREETLRGELRAPEATAAESRFTNKPFSSISLDSLQRAGYRIGNADSAEYHAPDAEVLLSQVFASTHCFRVVAGQGEHDGAFGVAFEPTASRQRGFVDIRGTIWMRPGLPVPRVVEFTYLPESAEDRQARAGGFVEFATTPGGQWFVRTWALRMPSVQVRTILSGRVARARTERSVLGAIVVGGSLMEMRTASRLLYQDTVEMQRAEEAKRSVMTARESLMRAATRSADGTIARQACGTRLQVDSGVVVGRVQSPSGAPVRDMMVGARWSVPTAMRSSNSHSGDAPTGVATRSGTDGTFVLCGIPLGFPVELVITIDTQETRGTTLSLAYDSPVQRATVNLSMTEYGAHMRRSGQRD